MWNMGMLMPIRLSDLDLVKCDEKEKPGSDKQNTQRHKHDRQT